VKENHYFQLSLFLVQIPISANDDNTALYCMLMFVGYVDK